MSLNQDGSYSYGNFGNGIGIGEDDVGGLPTIVGCDVRTKPGKITGSFSMANADSGSIVDKLAKCSVTLPNGDSFFGSSGSGKIWKVTSAGVVSLVHTNTEGNVLGMGEDGTNLYYASATKLGKIPIANASSESTWSSQNDSWGTFSIGDTAYKPMRKVGSMFLIGDGRYVAGVVAGTFYPNLFDAFTGDRVTAIGAYGSYALIGTIVSTSVSKSRIHLWDRFSQYPTTTDDNINESGVNMFIDGSVIYIQIGVVGNIYYWGGSQAILYTRLRDADNQVVTEVNPYGSANLNGLSLIATKRGIFSLGRGDAKLPIVQVVEYVPSQGQGVQLGALLAVGNQVFCAWYKSAGSGTYGIDKLTTNKYSGFFILPTSYGKLSSTKIFYSSMPDGTNITVELDKDNDGYESHELIKDDTNEMCFKSEKKFVNKAFVKEKVTLVANGAYSPEVYNVNLLKGQ